METLIIKTLEFLKGQSLQVAIVFIGVGILTWLLQNKSAHVRYLLWLLVAIKCLTPPLVIFSVPLLPAESIPAMTPSVRQPAETLPITKESRPVRNMTVTVTPEPMQSQKLIENRTSKIYPQGIENSSPGDQPSKTNNPLTDFFHLNSTGVLLFLWAAGAACYLLLAMGKAVRLGIHLRRIRRPLPAQLMIEQIEMLARLWNHPGGFNVWLVDGINQPFVWGLWRGAIYLPTRFQSIQGDKQKAIVLHEMAHVVRFDAFVNLIQILIQGVFWFHPFVWLANKAIRQEREKCCDEIAVARLGTAPKEYGHAIVDTLLQEAQAGLTIPTLAVAGPVKNIEDRIKTIMQPGRRFFHRPSTKALLIIGVLAAFVVPTTIALTQKVTPPDYTLSGTVTDAQTEKPIAGAIVFDDGYGPQPYQKGITDDNGKFEYKSWNEEHNIAAKADGYQQEMMVFTTAPFDNSKNLNFKLQNISFTTPSNSQFVAPPIGVNANPQDANQPMDRTFYFKLPLAQPQFHWKFTNKDLYLSGKLVLRIIRDDQINEIVVFNKGEITEGWKALCSERGPQDNAIYFGFYSTTKYSTTPNDKVNLELIAKEDLDGIGRLQTGVLKAGTHKAQGNLKIYSTDDDTAYIEWQDKWLLDITSEKGWWTSEMGFFIVDNGTLRSLTRAEKIRMCAGTNWRNSSFMGNSDISLIENITGKSDNESHFRKIRVRNDSIKKRVDIIDFTDEKQEQVQSKTTLVSERDSGGYLTQRFEHSQKKVFLENTDPNNDYNIFEFGRIDPKIAITISILCYLFDDDNQVESLKNATAFSDAAEVDQFQLINLKDNSIKYTLELNKMDWGLCRKIQWYNKGSNTLSKSIEYADFKRPVELKTSANPGDSGYLLPYRTVRRYFDNEGNEERTETLNIIDAAMVSNEKKYNYNVLRQNYGNDFDIEIPHDYMIIDRRSQGGQGQSKVSGEIQTPDVTLRSDQKPDVKIETPSETIPVEALSVREKERLAAINQIKQAAMGCILFAGDHVESLPKELEQVKPYLKEDSLPLGKMEYLQAGRKLSEIKDVAATALLRMHLNDGKDGAIVAYCDGHVEYFSPERMKSSDYPDNLLNLGQKTDVKIETDELQNTTGQTQTGAMAIFDGTKFKKRFFVTIVVDKNNEISSDSQKITFEQLEAIMSQIPDPAHTVLEVAFEPGAFPDIHTQYKDNPVFQKAGQWVEKYHLEYLSYVGEDHPENRRGPLSIRTEDEFETDKVIAVGMPAVDLNADKPLLTVNTIVFSSNYSNILADINMAVISLPKRQWEIKVRLLDKDGRQIDSIVHKYQKSGVILGVAAITNETLMFNFGTLELSKIAKFEIEVRQMQNIPQKPQAETQNSDTNQPHIALETSILFLSFPEAPAGWSDDNPRLIGKMVMANADSGVLKKYLEPISLDQLGLDLTESQISDADPNHPVPSSMVHNARQLTFPGLVLLDGQLESVEMPSTLSTDKQIGSGGGVMYSVQPAMDKKNNKINLKFCLRNFEKINSDKQAKPDTKKPDVPIFRIIEIPTYVSVPIGKTGLLYGPAYTDKDNKTGKTIFVTTLLKITPTLVSSQDEPIPHYDSPRPSQKMDVKIETQNSGPNQPQVGKKAVSAEPVANPTLVTVRLVLKGKTVAGFPKVAQAENSSSCLSDKASKTLLSPSRKVAKDTWEQTLEGNRKYVIGWITNQKLLDASAYEMFGFISEPFIAREGLEVQFSPGMPATFEYDVSQLSKSMWPKEVHLLKKYYKDGKPTCLGCGLIGKVSNSGKCTISGFAGGEYQIHALTDEFTRVFPNPILWDERDVAIKPGDKNNFKAIGPYIDTTVEPTDVTITGKLVDQNDLTVPNKEIYLVLLDPPMPRPGSMNFKYFYPKQVTDAQGHFTFVGVNPKYFYQVEYWDKGANKATTSLRPEELKKETNIKIKTPVRTEQPQAGNQSNQAVSYQVVPIGNENITMTQVGGQTDK